MGKFHVFLIAALAFSTVGAFADTWEDYCGGPRKRIRANSNRWPIPNYDNALIKAAAEKLNEVEQKEWNARKEDGKTEIYDGRLRQHHGKEWVDSIAFYLYSDMERVYGLCSGDQKKLRVCPDNDNKPDEIQTNTHNMLVILCGEYRDNLEALEKKLKWASEIRIVKDEEQAYDKRKGVWQQLTGEGYKGLVALSAALYEDRQEAIGESANPSLEIDQVSVLAPSECEYRYILSEWLVDNNWEEYDYDTYEAGLAEWLKGRNCTRAQKERYFEFRGDGNIKSHTMESNGMIWNGRNYSQNCKNNYQAKSSNPILTDEACSNYFEKPFTTRSKLTQQGFLRLMFAPERAQGLDIKAILEDAGDKFNDIKSDGRHPGHGSLIMITDDVNDDGVADMLVLDPDVVKNCPSLDADDEDYPGACRLLDARDIAGDYDSGFANIAKASKEIVHLTLVAAKDTLPASFKRAIEIAEKKLGENVNTDGIHLITEVHSSWRKSELSKKHKGFPSTYRSKEDAWSRLATVLDRHTEWYLTDMLNLSTGFYKPTFSPWFASSYYIDESHLFTTPGYAQSSDYDPGRMHWMYVQRVQKKQWYRASDMKAKWPNWNLDMFNMWFDETTFSRTALGASERGWNRYSMAQPEEMEVALWLYDVPKFELGEDRLDDGQGPYETWESN